MKGKLVIGYEHEDALPKAYSNHTATLHFELEIADDGLTKMSELAERVERLQKFCEAKVLEAIQRTRSAEPAPEIAEVQPPRDERHSPNRGGYDRQGGRGGGGRRNGDGPPRSARGLFGWAKDHDCLRWFSEFGRRQNWPKFITDWTDDDAMWAYDEYTKKGSSPPAWGGDNRNGQYADGRR